MFRWDYAIREVFAHWGGQAELKQVYDSLEEHFPLDEDDLRETVYGGRSAYKHVARSRVSSLKRRGDLVWLSRGRYALTEQGRQRYDAERET